LFGVGFGYIGEDNGDEFQETIKKIDYFSNIFIVDISTGADHHLSISDKGDIFSWGDNKFGQIGNGKSGETALLTPIKIFKLNLK
jgi:inhibitor of Bruton tyrosine kinase